MEEVAGDIFGGSVTIFNSDKVSDFTVHLRWLSLITILLSLDPLFAQDEIAAKRNSLPQFDICLSYLSSYGAKREAINQYQQSCVDALDSCGAENSPDFNACVAGVTNKYNEIGKSIGQSNPATTADGGESSAGPAGSCKDLTANAKSFCSNPVDAMSDGEFGGQNTQIVTSLMMGMTTAYRGANGGTAAICNLMKNAGGGMAALNGGLAARCTSLISDCEDRCNLEIKQYSGNSMYAAELKEAQKNLSICKSQSRKASEMAVSSSMSLMAGLQGKLCEDASKTNDELFSNSPPPDFDPTVPNCQTDQSNPLCRGVGGGPGGPGFPSPSGSGSGSGAFGDGGNQFSNIGDSDGFDQGENTGDGASSQAKNSGVPNGGGGMPGGGGGGDFGGGDEKGGRAAGAGYNANVLQGERGGGGYSGAGAGGGGGGWSGYGQGGDDEGKEKKSGFDLSKYLPGQKNAPTRGPAGMNRASNEIGAVHEDIFKKVSDRVKVVCLTKRLKDCDR